MALKLSTLFKLVIGLVVVLLIFTGAFIVFFDPNDYKDRIVAEIETHTGRSAQINGSIEWSVYPWLGIKANEFSLGNREGFESPEFLSVREAGLSVALIPLLRGDVYVDSVKLDGGRLNLQRKADGEDNWSDLAQSIAAENGKGPSGKSQKPAPKTFLINSIDIKDANLFYKDEQKESEYRITVARASSGNISSASRVPLDAQLRVGGTDVPESLLSLQGTLRADIEQQRFQIPDLVLTAEPRDATDQAVVIRGDVVLDTTNQLLTLTSFELEGAGGSALSGRLSVKGFDKLPVINGAFDITMLSVPRVTAAFGLPLPLEGNPRALDKISGKLTFSSDQTGLNLAPLDLNVDDSHIKGWVKANSFDPIKASFDLDIDKLILERYLPVSSGSVSSAGNAGTGESSPAAMELTGDLKIGQLDTAGQRINNILLHFDMKESTAVVKPLSLQPLGGPKVDADVTILDLHGEPTYKGNATLGQFDPGAMLSAMGVKVQTADKSVLKSASGSFGFNGTSDSIKLKPFNMVLDQSTVSGSLAISNFTSPSYSYALSVDKINLDSYLPSKSGTSASAGGAGSDAETLRTLRPLNMNGTLSVGWIKVYDLRMSGLKTTIKAGGGELTLSPLSASLYDGSYNGNIVLNSGGKALSWSANEELKGVSAGPFFKDLFGEERIDGKADINAKLSGWGASEQQIRSRVSGNASFSFRDGSFKGFNLAQAYVKSTPG